MRDYRTLEVWQLAKSLTIKTYQCSAQFPATEAYGLTNQLRRAAVSVPANIAEGVGRDGDAEFLRYLRIAHGSLNEVETLAEIAADLEYMSRGEHQDLCQVARRLGVKLRNLIGKLQGDKAASREVREHLAPYDEREDDNSLRAIAKP